MLKLTFPDLFSFYRETDIIESTDENRKERVNELKDGCGYRFGMTFEEMLNSKYSYTKGLDKLKKLNLNWDIGGKKRKYKWSEVDGDEMSTDRLNYMLPFMQQRVRKIGTDNGNYIDITINMDIVAGVDTDQLLYRSYMCSQICDWLEEQGYKVSITVYDSYSDPGFFRGKRIDKVLIEIPIKLYDEPLNKGLLMTTSSPWMLRYHIFKFVINKFTNARLCCGYITKSGITKTSIDIGYDGFTQRSAESFIKKVQEEISKDEE